MSILIAGLGRCGTTYHHTCIHRTIGGSRYFVNIPVDFAEHNIYKTHCYPTVINHSENLDKMKCLWFFGNPMDIVISTKRRLEEEKFKELHFINLQSSMIDESHKIFEKDVLNLERHFNKWTQQQDFDLMCINIDKYDESIQKEIEKFLGLKINWSPTEKRHSSYKSHNDKDLICKTYKSLNEKIEKFPSFKIFSKK